MVLTDNNWFLFADGAYREQNPQGLLADPSEDRFELWQAIVQYRQIRVDQAVAAFDKLRYQLGAQGVNARRGQGAPPLPEALDELKVLQATARHRNAALARARKAVDDAEPQESKNRRIEAAKSRAEAEAFLADLKRVEI